MNGTLQHQSLHRITYGCDHVLSSYSPNGSLQRKLIAQDLTWRKMCPVLIFVFSAKHCNMSLCTGLHMGPVLTFISSTKPSTESPVQDIATKYCNMNSFVHKIAHRDECIFTHIHLFNKMLQYELMHRNSCTGLCIEMNVSGNHTHLVNKVLQHELLCRIRQSYSAR